MALNFYAYYFPLILSFLLLLSLRELFTLKWLQFPCSFIVTGVSVSGLEDSSEE